MPVPLLWIGGALAGGYFLKSGAKAMDEATDLTKILVAGGALYVSYRALKSAGVIK